MNWIYLSPHLDDVALSLGGLVWEQTQAGEQAAIWTICAGDPPSGALSPFAEALHARWETGEQSMAIRRAEDITACRILGAEYLHFEVPDCIYRRSPFTSEPLYASEEALWWPLHPDEESLIANLTAQLQTQLPDQLHLVCPLTLGNHVDHRLTRAAAERLGIELKYYADYPYVLQPDNRLKINNLPSRRYPVSPDGLHAWQAAIAAHHSQISTFWSGLPEMRVAIQAYQQQMDGVFLFSKA